MTFNTISCCVHGFLVYEIIVLPEYIELHPDLHVVTALR